MTGRHSAYTFAATVCLLVFAAGEVSAAEPASTAAEEGRHRFPVPRTTGFGTEAHARTSETSPDTSIRPYSDAWFDRQRYVVAPWAHVLDRDVARAAVVHSDRLVFPAEHADTITELERLDIVISPVRRPTFLRRVLRTERVDGRLVVRTTDARLTEAILEGEIQSGGERPSIGEPELPDQPRRDQTAGGPYRKKRRALGDQVRNPESITYTSLGHWDIRDLGMGDVNLRTPYGVWNGYGGSLAFELSGRLDASVRPKYWFNLDIEFPEKTREPTDQVFFSTRACDDQSDCFAGGEAGGETCRIYDPSQTPVRRPLAGMLEAGQSYCVYDAGEEGTKVEVREEDGSTVEREEYRSCERLMSTLQYVKEGGGGEQCGGDWEPWYQSQGRNGARNPDSCQGWTWDAFAPYPAQLEWAKAVCGGSLQTLELDVRADVSAGIENFELGSQRGGFKAWDLIDPKRKLLGAPFFWVGPVPVLFTVNFQFHIPFFLYTSQGFHMNEGAPSFVGTDGTVTGVGTGIHVYGSREAYRNGHFGSASYPGYDYLNTIHPNTGVEASETAIEYPEVGGNVSGGAVLMLMPEFNTRLYDMVGPFVRPLSLSTVVKGAYGSETTCNLALTSGFKTDVGLAAQLPFGIAGKPPSGTQGSRLRNLLRGSPQLIWEVHNTCADSSPFVTFNFREPERNLSTKDGGVTGPKDPVCRDRSLCFETCFVGHCPDGESGGGKDDRITDGANDQPSSSTEATCSTHAGDRPFPWLSLVLVGWVVLRRRRQR